MKKKSGAKRLMEVGVPQKQAEVQAEALSEALRGEIATKGDIKELAIIPQLINIRKFKLCGVIQMFKDRREAGEKLAIALEKYKNEDATVLALPKGGIEIAFEVAKRLNLKFSIIIVRKLPFPDNPEGGFGAVAEDGSIYINRQSAWYLSEKEINDIILFQKNEIKRRISVLRKGKPLSDITGKTVILIDDGIAAGSTMRAAIMLCKKQGAKKVIAAVPVSGRDAAAQISGLADELVVLEMPYNFYAVAQVYENWYDVSDEEALEILGRHAINP